MCMLYVWPEDLNPKEACDQGKRDQRAAGIKFVQTRPVEVHPMKEYRRVPLTQLRRRLQVEEYESETPFQNVECHPAVARIKMRQHAGQPAVPVVQEGQAVGRVDEASLGANIHASIDGKVRTVTPEYVDIVA